MTTTKSSKSSWKSLIHTVALTVTSAKLVFRSLLCPGYPVGRVYAVDEDGTSRNNQTQYFIYSGAMDHFTVNSTSGVVSVQIGSHLLDRERIPDYNITVIAVDTGSPPRTGNTTFHVTIDDVNDELPVFTQSVYEAYVAENTTNVGVVATCNATDPDVDAQLHYTLEVMSGTDEQGKSVNASLLEVGISF